MSELLLFDVGVPGGGATFVGLGLGFFLVMGAIAFVAYRLLKRTVKWAIRIAIVGIILAIAAVGGLALVFGGSYFGSPSRREPPRQDTRR